MMGQNYQRGYIALVSTIIISVLLLAVTVGLGFSGFFGRLNIVDSESKERSSALAEACADMAILNLVKGLSTTGSMNVGSDTCSIISVNPDTPAAGQTRIRTRGIINKSYTNLEIIANSTTCAIISFKEVANF
jgi:hypothetical protein